MAIKLPQTFNWNLSFKNQSQVIGRQNNEDRKITNLITKPIKDDEWSYKMVGAEIA